MNKKILILLFSLIVFSSFVSAATTVLVNSPNGGESLNRQSSPFTIDFNVSGSDKNTLLIDINYSTSASQGTGTPIIIDKNTATMTCTGNDFNAVGKECVYSWDISHVPNGNYFILVDANNTSEGFDASNASFNVSSSYFKSYSGGDLGQIFIDIFGVILTTLARNIQAVVILIILGVLAVLFKEDVGKIFGIIKGGFT